MKKVILLLLTTFSIYGQVLERITPINDMNVFNFGNSLAHHNNDFIVGGFDAVPPTGNFRLYAFEKTSTGFVQNQIILPPEIDENYTNAIEIDNDFLFIGSKNNSSNVSNGGAVYVFKKTGFTWSYISKIQPSSLSSGENFGTYISFYDNQVFIGSKNYNSNGAIYVFNKIGDTFTFNQILTVNYNQNFGDFIDIENNFLITTNLNTATNESSVISYEKVSGSWHLVNEFNVGNLVSNRNLKVNYSNNQLFISRDGNPTPSPTDRKIDIYNFQSNNWIYDSFLEHAIGDYFEASVNVDNNKMIVSALGYYILSMERKNITLFYKKISGNWVLQNSFTGQSSFNEDNFGNLNKIKDETVVFGNDYEKWQPTPPFSSPNGGAYTIDTTLSANLYSKNEAEIYPNPVESILNIDNKSDFEINQITITDVNGRILSTTSSLTIDFSNYSKGIYFLKITHNNGNIYTKKILKN